MTHPEHDDTPADSDLTRAADALGHLLTIRNGWRHVLDPIRVTGAGSTRGGPRPATEDEQTLPPDARLDTPRTLAFWVHAALDEWPTILDRPEHVPVPTTDPVALPAWTIRVRTTTLDCADVYAMLDLLSREAHRIATWREAGHDFGATFLEELEAAARSVSKVAWPPKGDRVTIGDCPACGRRLRVKAPEWHLPTVTVPQPTTDPAAYPEWVTFVPDGSTWQPARDQLVTCRCGAEQTIEGWRDRLVDFEQRRPMTAEELVVAIGERLGQRYSPLTVRVWARRKLIKSVGKSKDGHATFDLTQVLAALIDREKRREQETA